MFWELFANYLFHVDIGAAWGEDGKRLGRLRTAGKHRAEIIEYY